MHSRSSTFGLSRQRSSQQQWSSSLQNLSLPSFQINTLSLCKSYFCQARALKRWTVQLCLLCCSPSGKSTRIRLFCADSTAKYLFTADQTGPEQQQSHQLGRRQPEHNTQVAVCAIQSDYKPDWHRLTEAATGVPPSYTPCNLACHCLLCILQPVANSK